MSRDWTPKELDYFVDEEQQKMVETMYQIVNGEKIPLYSKEDIELSHRYKKLGKCGYDFLMDCKELGIFNNDIGKQIIRQIEDILNNISVDNKELIETTNQWYSGRLVPGYDMSYNDQAFAEYVHNLVTKQQSEED